MLPKKIHILTRDLEILDEETPITKAWVCINPQEKRTEYTDLSQVWHDSSEIPQHDALILFQSIYGDILLIRFQDRKSSMTTIQRWAYVDDLLPKEVRYEKDNV